MEVDSDIMSEGVSNSPPENSCSISSSSSAISQTERKLDPSVYNPNGLPEYLSVYYKRLFPYGLFYRWLNYGHTSVDEKDDREFFAKREFCFTLKDDVYIRYNSFYNQKEMEAAVIKHMPYKIDIGPVYSSRVEKEKLNSVSAVQRELIFDIDMTDYDEVRVCCSGADICPKCWPLMALAVKVIHRALTDDFGFQHILWVYSGRRGVHCWVCDHKARFLSVAGRQAIIGYISLIQHGKIGRARSAYISDFDRNHFATQKALKFVQEFFVKHIVNGQGVMESEKGLEKIYSMLEDPALVANVKKAIEHVSGNRQRWDKVCHEVEKFAANASKYNNVILEMQVQFCYPRLDINVSNSLNHLLKSPYSVHPKTGRVCVAFNPDTVDNFDPFRAPTVSQLVEEINQFNASQRTTEEVSAGAISSQNIADWKKTSLKESLTVFEYFVKKMEIVWRKDRRALSDRTMEF
ncbi:DNA primase small subunit-like [Paramacrobiotus metropolitanus]|uniref:DNA primase small subunit-like n=1 Tax=Paramacrobiotus metropolitanus TaxID=2943436 RepID=UPI002445FCD1|nr:DNA primase small subunit-like [Paramacrobiotus metropolitanus]